MSLTREYTNPQSGIFSEVVSTQGTGPIKTIWLSGCVAAPDALDKPLREQAASALAQVKDALAKAGAGVEDVVRYGVFIKENTQEKMVDVAKAFFKETKHLGAEKQAPNSFIGVTALADPRMLIEIEATAQVAADASSPPGVTRQYMENRAGLFNVIVTSVSQGPTTTLWIAGHTAEGAALDQGPKEQAASALAALKRTLASKGASFKDVVRFNTYMPFLDGDKLKGMAAAFTEGLADLPKDQKPANTLLGVTGLVDPKMMLECEAVAVIPTPGASPGNAVMKEFIGPQEKMNFSEAVGTTSTPGAHFKTLWLAGQTGGDSSKSTQEQVDLALTQIDAAIKKAGGKGFEDVVNIQTYLFEPRKQENIVGFARALNKHTKHLPRDKRAANTLVGTTGLAGGAACEIQCTAVIATGGSKL